MNILITGGRFFTALELARSFYRVGHKVFIADSMKRNITSFSNSIEKSFTISSPRFAFKKFTEDLKGIINDCRIDAIIPVFEETLYLAKAKDILQKEGEISSHVEFFCPNLPLLEQLHDKWQFVLLMQKFQLQVPPSKLVLTGCDLDAIDLPRPYVLKPCFSRGSFGVKKITEKMSLPKISIQSNNPWVAQAWIEGKKYCSYSICRSGNIQAHVVYPNEIVGSGYCLNFQPAEHKEIFEWVKKIVKATDYTGQISFDFIQQEDGSLFALECNPRSTSGLHLLALHPHLASFFFEDNPIPFQMIKGKGKQLSFGMLCYGWRSGEKKLSFFRFVKRYFSCSDVVFSIRDIKPFFFQLIAYWDFFLQSIKNKLSLPMTYVHDLIWDNDNKV